MIRINLLPVRQARKESAAQRELLLLGTIGALVLLGCLAGWAFTTAQIASVKAESAAIQTEINRLEEEGRKVEATEKVTEELKRKLDGIDELRRQKSGPVHVLSELADATPERVMLSSLKQKGNDVEITGISVNNEVISQFLRALEASDYFEAVYLKNIEAQKDARGASAAENVPLKKFQLSARLTQIKSSDASKDKEKGGEKAGDKGAAAPKEGAGTGAAGATAPAAPAATGDAAATPTTGATAAPAAAEGTAAPAPAAGAATPDAAGAGAAPSGGAQ